MKVITLEWLRKERACDAAQKRFEAMFGRSCEVTAANALRWMSDEHQVQGLELYRRGEILWVVRRLLTRHDPVSGIRKILPLAGKVVAYLWGPRMVGALDVYHIYDRLFKFTNQRLAAAAEQIAARSPRL